MDRLRASLAEVLAANVAYPPFFDYQRGKPRTRPADRAKRDEIDSYLRSVNFEPLRHLELTSPEIRRFLERLMVRYIEVNPALAQPRLARRLPELRSRVPRMAGEVHRGLLAASEGNAGSGLGSRLEQVPSSATSSTAASERPQPQPRSAEERNTRVLEAILLRHEHPGPSAASSALTPLSAPAPASPTPAAPPPRPERPAAPVTQHPAAAPAWLVGTVNSDDQTTPVPTPGWSPAPAGSPFAGLESGAQSAVFGAVNTVDGARSLPDRPTNPLPAVPAGSPAYGAAAPGAAHELPPDLYQLYGEYLRDMEPEAEPPAAITLESPAANADATRQTVSPQVEPSASSPCSLSEPLDVPVPGRVAHTDDASRGDKLIFWQLRYQLEAYIRRAIRSYGVRGASDDPFSMLDALRRSGFVDEADLRIAEGILALTDRVTATGDATIEDYRQAFLLYLLYHRSHLGT